MINFRGIFLLLSFLGLTSCGIFPEKVAMNDPKIKPLLDAAGKVDRASLGFSPLPQSADVRLEIPWKWQQAKYDVMLHIDAETSRTISFRKDQNGYRWIGEQEIYSGPKEYTTVDGTSHEEICITYEIEKISGYPLNQINVSYNGDDPRLKNRENLTLSDVSPIIKE